MPPIGILGTVEKRERKFPFFCGNRKESGKKKGKRGNETGRIFLIFPPTGAAPRTANAAAHADARAAKRW